MTAAAEKICRRRFIPKGAVFIKRVLVALSGGVDSAAAALMLLKLGYDAAGAVLEMNGFSAPAVAGAEKTAAELGIPLYTGDMKEEFSRTVIDGFAAEYAAGRTPNPCILCNEKIKFPALMELAEKNGYDHIATGHYARIGEDGLIRRARCEKRDQSYMLYRLDARIRSKLILPLGDAESKEQVRRLAMEAGLSCHSAPDSSENCFLPGGRYAEFLKTRLRPEPGDIISPSGEVCGRHDGIYNFTVGQRRGLGSYGVPVFVKRIDPAENRIYLAESGGEFFGKILIKDCVWHAALPESFEARVKIRSGAPLAACTVDRDGAAAVVTFSEPQRAPAPGQSAAVYRGDSVAGGGVIACAV